MMKSLKKASMEPLPPGTPRKIRSMFKMPNLADLAGRKDKSKKNAEDDSSVSEAEGASKSEAPQNASLKEENPANETSPKGRRLSSSEKSAPLAADEKKDRQRRRSLERKSETKEEKRARSRSAKRDKNLVDAGGDQKVKSKPRRRSLDNPSRTSKTPDSPVVESPKTAAGKMDSADRRLVSPRAVVAAKKKVKRRKSIGTTSEAEAIMENAKNARDSARRSTRSTHSAITATSVGTSIGSEGYDDLMANLDAADKAASSRNVVPSPSVGRPKLRTTVDGTGKIRRVSRGGDMKQEFDASELEDEEDPLATSKAQRASLRQKVLIDAAERRTRSTARNLRASDIVAPASPQARARKLDEVEERVARRRHRNASFSGTVRSVPADINDDISIASTRSAQSVRSENFQSTGRSSGGRMSLRDATQDIDARGKSHGSPPGGLVTGRSVAPPGRSDASVGRSIHSRSDVSIDSVIERYASVVSDPNRDVARLERELFKSEESVRALIEEQRTGQAEAAKARTELMHLKLDFQKIEKQNREMRDELRVVDDHLDEKKRKIANLEMAVESQLDKLDDLEAELKNAQNEADNLECKLKEMEEEMARLLKGGTNSADVTDMKKRLEEKRERRLEMQQRSLDEKARELAEEKKKLQALMEQQRRHGDIGEDRILLEELKQEQDETAAILIVKDAAIEELHQKLERALEAAAAANALSDSPSSPRSSSSRIVKQKNDLLEAKLKKEQVKAAAILQKKDDTIAFMKLEMEKLKKQLSSRDLNDTGGLKREMDAVHAEANAIRNQLEGSNRRNEILEVEIDHFKQLSCNLEDDLNSWKSEAAEWKAKYESMMGIDSVGNDGKNGRSSSTRNLGHSGSMGNLAGAAKYMRSGSDHGFSNDGGSVHSSTSELSSRTITNLWNKLVSPAPGHKPSVSGTGLPDLSFH